MGRRERNAEITERGKKGMDSSLCHSGSTVRGMRMRMRRRGHGERKMGRGGPWSLWEVVMRAGIVIVDALVDIRMKEIVES